jgi:hypothetical protein
MHANGFINVQIVKNYLNQSSVTVACFAHMAAYLAHPYKKESMIVAARSVLVRILFSHSPHNRNTGDIVCDRLPKIRTQPHSIDTDIQAIFS